MYTLSRYYPVELRIKNLICELVPKVYSAGNCHETIYESAHFVSDHLVVVEGTREATSCRQALTELIDYCEMEFQINTFIIAMPRKRHDHLAYGKSATFWLISYDWAFELICSQ